MQISLVQSLRSVSIIECALSLSDCALSLTNQELEGVVKYKSSALFWNLCDSCMSVRALLLFSCVHSLGLGLDLGYRYSLDRRGEKARALIHKS